MVVRCESGYCCCCGVEISEVCLSCGARQFSSRKREVMVEWSNGSKMPIGICESCDGARLWQTPEKRKSIALAHFDYWEKNGGSPDRTLIIV